MAKITVIELSASLDTDPRTARKFLRSITPREMQPGKGGRWAIEKREVRSLKSKFAKFLTAQEEARIAREAKKVEDATEEVEVSTDEEIEPTFEELDAIETE